MQRVGKGRFSRIYRGLRGFWEIYLYRVVRSVSRISFWELLGTKSRSQRVECHQYCWTVIAFSGTTVRWEGIEVFLRVNSCWVLTQKLSPMRKTLVWVGTGNNDWIEVSRLVGLERRSFHVGVDDKAQFYQLGGFSSSSLNGKGVNERPLCL